MGKECTRECKSRFQGSENREVWCNTQIIWKREKVWATEKLMCIWEIMYVIFSRDDPSWTVGRSPSWKWRQLQHWNMPTRTEVTLGICILRLFVIVYCDCVWIWHWSLSTKAQTRLKTSILFVFIYSISYFSFLFSIFVRFSVQAGGRTINCIKL